MVIGIEHVPGIFKFLIYSNKLKSSTLMQNELEETHTIFLLFYKKKQI